MTDNIQTTEFSEDALCAILEKLSAKAWQSTKGAKDHRDHICWKAMRAIQYLMHENDVLKGTST